MGLAVFIAWLKTVSYLDREHHRFPLWRKIDEERERYELAARFWAKIFAVNFAVGVVTGIPMEFQFGTNWASFSEYAGGVIGQTLAIEGVFAFFAESVFLGIFLAGRERLSPRPADESVARVDLRAQHERCGDHGCVRAVRDGRPVSAA
jgi:cytochrome d ubiquinol oxidase subunit I